LNFQQSWTQKIFPFRFLGKRGVKEEIIDFDPRTITSENREGVEKLLKKSDSFEPDVSYRVIDLTAIWTK
jgi:hypothetical protein